MPGTDLLALTAAMVGIPSVSHHEAALADWVAERLTGAAHLRLTRLGDTLVARTDLGRSKRLLLAGHLDTVPPPPSPPGASRPNGGPSAAGGGDRPGPRPSTAVPRGAVPGDAVRGLGAVDMKGGLAVLIDLAEAVTEPAVDVTYVLYACEEVSRADNALGALARDHPELLAADAAVLAEPTGGRVEAGCQGTLRARVRVAGRRAHTARPWAGVNAVHRLQPALGVLARYRPRSVELDGCTYTEQLQAVGVAGGVAGNVVPDSAELTVNFRFAPDRDEESAEGELRRLFAPALDEAAGDQLELVDVAPAAAPALGEPLLEQLVAVSGQPARAKVGWTDVATLAALGIPATNFGPGDPLLAHTPDEVVTASELVQAHAVLSAWLAGG